MIKFLLDRAKEPSTWRGAVLLATAAGVNIAPELVNAIVTFGIGLAGLLGVVTKG
jgi:uncharacterized membrane protein